MKWNNKIELLYYFNYDCWHAISLVLFVQLKMGVNLCLHVYKCCWAEVQLITACD